MAGRDGLLPGSRGPRRRGSRLEVRRAVSGGGGQERGAAAEAVVCTLVRRSSKARVDGTGAERGDRQRRRRIARRR